MSNIISTDSFNTINVSKFSENPATVETKWVLNKSNRLIESIKYENICDSDIEYFPEWERSDPYSEIDLIEVPGGVILPRASGTFKIHGCLNKFGQIIQETTAKGTTSELLRINVLNEIHGRYQVKKDVLNLGEASAFVMLSPQSANNYFHWHAFYMVLLVFLDQIKKRQNSFLVTPRLNELMRKTIEYSGLSLQNVVEFEGKGITARSVLFPSSVGYITRITNSSLKIFEKITNNITEKNQGDREGGMLYISRGIVGQRNLLNEDILVQELKRIGFKVVSFSNLSIECQVSLVKNATIVVAPHGAALTNLVYTKNLKLLVELFSNKWMHGCFRDLALTKGARYAYVVTEAQKGSATKLDRTSDHLINKEQVKKIISYVESFIEESCCENVS